MTDTPRYATAPGHVRAVAFPHVLVLINYRTGGVQCLLPKSAAHWHEAARSGRLTAMPGLLAAHLLHIGALYPTPATVPWAAPVSAPAPAPSWGSAEHPQDSPMRPAASRRQLRPLSPRRRSSNVRAPGRGP